VNRAFNAKGVAFNSRSFRVQLGLARTVPDKLYLVDRSYVGIGNKVFAELFDSSFVETLHKPETLYRVLSGELKTLP
jgi:hypothetical protein